MGWGSGSGYEGIGLVVVDKRWWIKRRLLITLSHILNITLI